MPPRKNKQKAVQIAPPLIIPGSPTYPGKKDGKGLEAPQWEACRRMVEGVYNTTEDGYVFSAFTQLMIATLG